jgi:hypothetical protein
MKQLTKLDYKQPASIAVNIIKTAKAVGIIQGEFKGFNFGAGVGIQLGYTTVT